MRIPIPDLTEYRSDLIGNGAIYPLNTVEFSQTGLLDKLPRSAENKEHWTWKKEVAPDIYKSITNWPRLTIVTPSYNQGRFIEETIRSVLLQNYPNLEYIVVDGGSTDDTKSILEKYSRWISYWCSEKDNGQSHAINKGFSLASGDYLAWINSDDYYLENTFLNVISTFLKTRSKFVYGYGFNFKYPEKEYSLIKVPVILDSLLRFPNLVQPSCFWSADIHQPVWEELHCSLDFELWLRMINGVKKTLIRQPLSVTNVHQDAKTHNPAMGIAWAKDHQLISNENAHGVVRNWRLTHLLYRVWMKLNKWVW